jgi:hypothetical protein
MFDPPLTQQADKHMLDPWIWVATIVVMVVLLTTSGLFAPVANQNARDADGNVNIAQGGPLSGQSAR